jgi:hypothetical protein
MSSAHEVGDLALDLGASRSVALAPSRVTLADSVAAEEPFLGVRLDHATGLAGRAAIAQAAGGAVRIEGGHTLVGVGLAELELDDDPRRALDGVAIEVDLEVVLAEETRAARWLRDFDVGFDARRLQAFDDLCCE